MADWGGLLDKGLEKLDDGWEGAKKVVGQGVDKATDGIGTGLEYIGADGWADKVEDWGDDVASDLGASVRSAVTRRGWPGTTAPPDSPRRRSPR
ncbi:putative T7SS-secreted protein [Streptomyces sp. A1547]|uniref:putative T7SS-secreted protein n=1 Tax=Streptomyces sp. A1547 TaxID=2563105 RepID=UPI00109ED465|nr:hypothetical protein [Streptomyces sp. A1547]THA29428.1 hypothetical protein E6W17_39400 [Streptomyces sp. A1547]